MNKKYTPMATLALLAMASLGSAQYFDNFDVDHSANWTINRSDSNPANNVANVFFDYSTVGIPSAPGAGGTTRGLMLAANVQAGVFGGLSASPTGESFTGDYRLTAQVWLNFIGPAPAGGSGSTQLGGLGIGTAGASAQWPGGSQDSVWFSATGDGGSGVDWRAYSSAAGTGYPDQDPVFFATGPGNRNNTHAYYSQFGNVPIPASQGALFASQTGSTAVGTAGFMWRTMVVEKLGNNILWTVTDNNGLATPIAQVDASTVTLSGSNILLMSSDINSTSSSTQHGLTFALFDNVTVTPVPEPATMAVLGLGAAALLRRRRK